MAKIKRRKLKWIASDSSQVVGYKLYWSEDGTVNYDSKCAILGNVTEIVLPDDVNSFTPNGGPIEFAITALDELGNEVDKFRNTSARKESHMFYRKSSRFIVLFGLLLAMLALVAVLPAAANDHRSTENVYWWWDGATVIGSSTLTRTPNGISANYHQSGDIILKLIHIQNGRAGTRGRHRAVSRARLRVELRHHRHPRATSS